jgi:xylulokinase
VDPEGRLHTFCHAVKGKWHMMGVTLTAGGALEWFVRNLCSGLGKKVDPYSVLNREAEAIPAGSEGLNFLPYLAGERTPHADPDARGSFVGITLKHERGHVARSIMEGVTYAMRDSLEIIKGMGVPVKQIRVSGGGAKSRLWRQLQADIFGQNVVTINAEQGPAFGVALLAAVGAGAYRNIEEACAATIKVKDKTTKNSKNKLAYDQRFPLYQQLYQSLKNDFKTISSIEG